MENGHVSNVLDCSDNPQSSPGTDSSVKATKSKTKSNQSSNHHCENGFLDYSVEETNGFKECKVNETALLESGSENPHSPSIAPHQEPNPRALNCAKHLPGADSDSFEVVECNMANGFANLGIGAESDHKTNSTFVNRELEGSDRLSSTATNISLSSENNQTEALSANCEGVNRPHEKCKQPDDVLKLLDKDGENLIEASSPVEILPYTDESDLPGIIGLITKDLSEPYSIYTYRYFIHNWPQLCFKARLRSDPSVFVGAIVCKLDMHRMARRGYIAMLAVHSDYRRFRIGSSLVRFAIFSMIAQGCDEVVLETEVTNKAAMKLYEKFGFIKDKRLHRYYLNGVDAFRLKLWIT